MRTPHQPDFAPGGAVCGAGVDQRRPDWEIFEGKHRVQSAGGIPSADKRAIGIALAAARGAMKDEMAAATEDYVLERLADEAIWHLDSGVKLAPKTPEEAVELVLADEAAHRARILSQRNGGVLHPSTIVQFKARGSAEPGKAQYESHKLIEVCHRREFHGRRMRNPVEPDYDQNGSTSAKLLVTGGTGPRVICWAHSGPGGPAVYRISRLTEEAREHVARIVRSVGPTLNIPKGEEEEE